MSRTKISILQVSLLITVAGIVDLVQAGVNLLHFIPVVGNALAAIITAFVTVFVWLVFFVWLKMLGVSLISPKKALTFAGGGLFELIPALNALPGWTLAIVLTIIWEKKDEILPAAVSKSLNVMAKGKARTKYNVFDSPDKNYQREREARKKETQKRQTEKQNTEEPEQDAGPKTEKHYPPNLPQSQPPAPHKKVDSVNART